MQTRDDDLLFQAEADTKEAARRNAKSSNNAGNSVVLPSKALAMLVDTSGKDPIAYVAESGFGARAINLRTGKAIGVFKGHNGPVTSVVRYGQSLYTGSWDKSIRRWALDTRQTTATLLGHSDFVKCLAISQRRGLLISGSSDKDIRVWDASAPITTLATLKGHTRAIECLVFDEDENFLYSGSSDRSIRRWKMDSNDFECVQIIQGHEGIVYSLAFYEGELWSGSADLSIKAWDVTTKDKATVVSSFELHKHESSAASEHTSPVVTALLIYPPYIVSGARDELVRAHDLASGKFVGHPIDAHYHEVTGLQIVPNWDLSSKSRLKLVTASLDGTIRSWNYPQVFTQERNTIIPVKASIPVDNGPKLSAEEQAELDELMADD